MTGLYVASNPTALTSQFQLMRNMGSLGETLTRLSTGMKLNAGKDDPAGLIASELIRAQLTGTNQAIVNTQRANALFATADGALAQIGNLLNDIKGLTVEAAQTGTMTNEQIAANQLQVDLALDSIDRIARTTNYGGKKLLDGSLDFRTAGASGVSTIRINNANFGTASSIGVNVNVQEAADYARLVSNGTGVGVATMFDIVGNKGSATVSVGAGASNAEIAAAINRSTDSTGVLAYVEGAAARGSTVLSSAGANNDILITANTEGYDAGNYSFRITRTSGESDARVVQEAGAGQPGIIEISLTEGREARYDNFAGLFNIAIDTTQRGAADQATSVTMTQGNANQVTYSASDKDAGTNVVGARSMTAAVTDGAKTSALNGWTIAVDNTIVGTAGEERADINTKTVYINSTSNKEQIETILGNALAKTEGGAVGDPPTGSGPSVSVYFNHDAATNGFQNGDRFTFTGGASAGEVMITYKEGATANDILAMLNNAPNVTASLASGVDGNALIKNLPSGQTSVSRTDSAVSRYSSGASAQDVIDLINSKLGHLFTASNLVADGTSSGRVSYMDAAVDYGDINMGNALRFTGMDNGPIVRLTNLNASGGLAINQKLSVNIIKPNDADIAAGVHTPILEIKLATDGQGNSITTSKDIADLFKTLTAEQTMGISVSQLYPPGVDPNGRIFGTTECGKPFVVDTCPTPINGIVQPTGAPGPCGAMQGDLILLGTNQHIVADNAVGRIMGHNRPIASTGPVTTTGTNPPATTYTEGFTGGTVANTATFDAISAVALSGLSVQILQSGSGSSAGTPGFGDGVITLDFDDAGAEATDATILAALNNMLAGTTLTDQNVRTAMNSWLTLQGKSTIDPGLQITSLSFADGTSTAITGGLAAGDQFTFAANPLKAPELTFSQADAKLLSEITFVFSEDAAEARYNPTAKTIVLGLGGDADSLTDDDAFLNAVNAALQTLSASDLAQLGFEAGAAAPQAQIATKNGLVVATDFAAAQSGASSTATMPLATDTSIAKSAGIAGATELANAGEKGYVVISFNGANFRIEGDGVEALALTFEEGTVTADFTAPNELTVDISGATTNMATSAAFANFLQTQLNAALGQANDDPTYNRGGVTAFTVTARDVPGSTWQAVPGAITSDAQVVTALGSPTVTAGTAEAATAIGTTVLTFENTSAMNGITFGFTREESKEGFDASSGTLMVYLGTQFSNNNGTLDALRGAVNDAVAANWEAIRAFTGATGDAVRLAADQDLAFTVDNALADAKNGDRPGARAVDGKTRISPTTLESNLIDGTRGVGPADQVLTITAKQAGTEMAGVKIHFVNDTNSSLAQYNTAYDARYAATAGLPELKVEFNGTDLVITGNLGPNAASEMNAGILAKALNANGDFNKLFSAGATQFGNGDMPGGGVAGSVLFNTGVTSGAATMTGGYRVESTGPNSAKTSSGIGMSGQSDSNERLVIESEELGSNSFVEINVVSGSLNFVDEYGYGSSQAHGRDMRATINGLRASTAGNNVSINTPDLSVSMNVNNATGNYGFNITGGGALLQLGPDVVSQQQMRVGIGSMLTTNLGGRDGQLFMLRTGEAAALTSDDNGRKLADRIVMQAITDVSTIRGRLGAVQKGSLEPNILALQDSVVALTDANAMITNADFAVESSNLARLQLLIQAGANTLGIANQLPQYAAMLVR